MARCPCWPQNRQSSCRDARRSERQLAHFFSELGKNNHCHGLQSGRFSFALVRAGFDWASVVVRSTTITGHDLSDFDFRLLFGFVARKIQQREFVEKLAFLSPYRASMFWASLRRLLRADVACHE